MNVPWIEKYRPKDFDHIVMNEKNKTLIQNIMTNDDYPNMLFYGPPGTGKTTTMVNLINLYQEDVVMKKGLCIHLNASDERGIDTIRHQISLFVNSSGLFSNGMKFIILDEVDYMTKSAQLGLKYLIENSNDNVRFCLICNYISKIDRSLQNSFIRLKFNSLPKDSIVTLLKEITVKEKLNLSNDKLYVIQSYFNSDIRSMINYIQTNKNDVNIVDSSVLDKLVVKNMSHKSLVEKINKICVDYNVDRYSLIKDYIKYNIINKKYIINTGILLSLESIIRNFDTVNNSNLNYILFKLLELENV